MVSHDIETKNRWFLFQQIELDCLRQFLEEEAKNGWILEKVRWMRFTFKKHEPVNVKYGFDLLHETNQPSPELEENGWKYVCSSNAVNIYMNENDSAPPLFLDYDRTIKKMKKGFLSSSLSLIITMILFFSRMSMDYTYSWTFALSQNFDLFIFLIYLYVVLSIMYFVLWWIKTISEKENKHSLPSMNNIFRWLSKGISVLFISFGLFLLVTDFYGKLALLGILLTLLFLSLIGYAEKKWKLQKDIRIILAILFSLFIITCIATSSEYKDIWDLRHKNMERISNKTTTSGSSFQYIYHDTLPLDLEDLNVSTNDKLSHFYEESGNPFIKRAEGRISYVSPDGSYITDEHPEMWYVIYQTNFASAYDFMAKEKQFFTYNWIEEQMEKTDEKPFLAKEAYSSIEEHSNYYSLLYSDKVVHLYTNFELSAEQMQTVGENLN